VHKVLVQKPEGKRPLGRPPYGNEENIKKDLDEIRLEWCGLIDRAVDRN
jgi:hypothetical protein